MIMPFDLELLLPALERRPKKLNRGDSHTA